MSQSPKAPVHAEDLNVIGAGGVIRGGGRARQLQHGGGRGQVGSQGGAEEAVCGGQGERDAANAGQGQVAQAFPHAVADGQSADENGHGHRHPQERAEVGAGVITQVGAEQIHRSTIRSKFVLPAVLQMTGKPQGDQMALLASRSHKYQHVGLKTSMKIKIRTQKTPPKKEMQQTERRISMTNFQ